MEDCLTSSQQFYSFHGMSFGARENTTTTGRNTGNQGIAFTCFQDLRVKRICCL